MFLGILMRFLSKEGHCLPRSHSKARFLSTPYSNVFHQTSPVLVRTRRVWNLGNVYSLFSPNLSNIECFRMTSRRPYWCPKTMKRPPCWCPKPILWELNSFLMQTLFFVPINLHRCWPREFKHSIAPAVSPGCTSRSLASLIPSN